MMFRQLRTLANFTVGFPPQNAIGGYFNSTNQSKPHPGLRNWMSRLMDSTAVWGLSIPGTHDSGTFGCNREDQFCFSSQCQSLNIKQQLNAGIRFLDLRLAKVGGEFRIYHGNDKIVFGTFKDVAKDLGEFLAINNQEFVILSFQGNLGNKEKEGTG
jgi:hypothetical protein